MWDKGSLHELIEAKIKDYPMIVVANREPFVHYYEEGGETIAMPAARERDGDRARPGDAGVGRGVGRPWLGGCRSSDGRRVRSRSCSARRSQLHAASGCG